MSDVPAIAVKVDVLNGKSGGSYPVLKPFEIEESGVFKRIGSKSISIAAGTSSEYPLISVSDLQTVVHPEFAASFCPFDATLSLVDTSSTRMTFDEADPTIPSFRARRPITQKGTLLRLTYRTIFAQTVTSYVVVFIDYADTRFTGEVWIPSQKKEGALRCIKAQGDPFGVS